MFSYWMVQGVSLDDLLDKVNKSARDGWRLFAVTEAQCVWYATLEKKSMK